MDAVWAPKLGLESILARKIDFSFFSINQDLGGELARINQNQPKATRTSKNPPEPARISQNQPEPTRTSQNRILKVLLKTLKTVRINQNQSKATRTSQNPLEPDSQPESTRTNQDQPKSNFGRGSENAQNEYFE